MPAPVVTATAALAAAVTTVLAYTGAIDFEYRSATAHLVLETLNAFVAASVAYLMYGRFQRSRRLQDLLLLYALAPMTVAGISTTGMVLALGPTRPGTVDAWLPLTVRVSGIVLLTAAAVVGPRRLVDPRGRGWLLVPPAALLIVIAGTCLATAGSLPVALDPSLSPQQVGADLGLAHPVLVAAMILTVVCFAVSAIVFTRQASGSDDDLLRWLGPACAVAAFARANYVLFPSLYSDWVYTGDLIRTGFFLLLLVGAALEIRRYWPLQARLAVLEDRRRLARELHDGVLQELGFIRAEARPFAGTDRVRTERILGACDRAIDEARQAVDALGRPDDEQLGGALRRAARQAADRYGVSFDLDLDDSITAARAQRHALLRIAREAVTNAVRHGGSQRISLQLGRAGSSRRLVVADDGRGFDVDDARTGAGFGLTSMRERAEALPGAFEVETAPGRGTVVTVRW